MYKKSCPFLWLNYKKELRQDFLDILYRTRSSQQLSKRYAFYTILLTDRVQGNNPIPIGNAMFSDEFNAMKLIQ